MLRCEDYAALFKTLCLYLEEFELMKWAFIEGFESARLGYYNDRLIKPGSDKFSAWRYLAKSELDNKCSDLNVYHAALNRMELELVQSLKSLYDTGYETHGRLVSEKMEALEEQAQKVVDDIHGSR